MAHKPKKEKKAQSFLHGAFILTISTVIVKIIGAFFKIPIARILGGVGNSYFEASYAIYNPIDVLAVAGLPVAISKIVAENATKKRFNDVRLTHRVSKPIFCLTGSFFLIFMLICSTFYVKSINSPKAIYSIFALAPTVLFSCFMSIYRGYYQGLRNMTPTAISEVLEAICKLVFGLGLAKAIVYYGMQEYSNNGTVFGIPHNTQTQAENFILPFASAGAILGITIGAFASCIFLFIRHKIKGDGITEQEIQNSPKDIGSLNMVKTLITLAIPIAASAFIMNIAGFIDTIIIRRQLVNILTHSPNILLNFYGQNIPQNRILNGEVHDFLAGCFGYVSSISTLIPGVSQVFGTAALPNITATWAQGQKKELQKKAAAIIRFTALFALPAGLGLSVLGGPILNLLYGSARCREVNVASGIITTMAVAAIFNAMSLPICSMLQAIGKAKTSLKILFVGVIIKILANYIFVGIPHINIRGAGVGSLFCFAFVFLAGLYCICKEINLHINWFLSFFKPAFASIFCVITAYYSLNLLNLVLEYKFSTVLSIIIAAFVYLLMLFLTKTINKNDLKLILQGRQKAATPR